jgi:hypothetical protein
VHCTVGICPPSGGAPDASTVLGGVCPAVLPDGDSCKEGDVGHTCDTFAACTGGACHEAYSVACP